MSIVLTPAQEPSGSDDPASPPAPLRRALIALLGRDPVVPRQQPGNLVARTVVQPLTLLFVLGHVAPTVSIGPGTAARQTQAATVLLPGMLAMIVLFQGLFSVAMPLMQESGITREIEDRVMSPIPLQAVAIAEVPAESVQGLLAAVVVFPLAEFVPVARPQLRPAWPVQLTVAPLAAVMCSALGPYLATALDPPRRHRHLRHPAHPPALPRLHPVPVALSARPAGSSCRPWRTR